MTARALTLAIVFAGGLAASPALADKTKADAWFDRLDQNGDGVITQEESLAKAQRRFKKLDADGDGQISEAEFMARHERRFAEADADGDGKVTREEFHAAMAAHRARKRDGAASD